MYGAGLKLIDISLARQPFLADILNCHSNGCIFTGKTEAY